MKYIWQILVLVLTIGIIGALCIAVFVCDNFTTLGFAIEIGSTLILGGVPLYILHTNRADNKAKEEKRIKQENFERMQAIIEQNYRLLDYESVVYAIQLMSINPTQVMNILYALLRQIEEQTHRYDLNLPYSLKDNYVREYGIIFDNCLKEYGRFINDMILACYIQQMIVSDSCNKTTMNEALLKLTRLFKVSTDVSALLFSEKGLIDKLQTLKDNEKYSESVQNAIKERINDMLALHSMKMELSRAGMELIQNKRSELTS